MDGGPRVPGESSAEARVELGEGPLSFWLRHAHRWGVHHDQISDSGPLRTSDDWMLMLPLEHDSWIWWGPAGGSVALPVGSAALIPPRVLHAHSWRAGAHYAIHFDLQAQPRLLSPLMLHHTGARVAPRPLPATPRFTLRRSGPGDDLVFAVISALDAPEAWYVRCERLSFLYGTRTHLSLPASIEIADTLAWMLRALALPEPGGDTPARRVLELLARLGDRDLAEPHSLAAMARRAGLGRTAFWNAVVEATGATPRRWLEERRVELAAHRLRETDRPIQAIAAEVGYADPFHFSRVFRRVTGQSPRRWRLIARAPHAP